MVKYIHYTSCLRKTSEEKYAASLGTKAKQFFFKYLRLLLKKCQKHRDSTSHIEITITNASIDEQITLKRDYIYKIENTDLEIGVSGVLLRILLYFEARRCSIQPGSVYALRINLLMSWYIYNNEVKRIK